MLRLYGPGIPVIMLDQLKGSPEMKIVSRFWVWVLSMVAMIVAVTAQADVSTNDILGIADNANAGFQKGFGIGLPILIVVVMLGWLLYGLTRGVRGKK